MRLTLCISERYALQYRVHARGEPMNIHYAQMQALQSMLAAGHRSVYLERHSLLLIGGVGGFIAGATEFIITAERFPDLQQRACALLFWLTFWLGAMAWLDHHWTQRARSQRDETLPFAQKQITRAWWMLLSMGVLGSVAMFFYGGGAMIYALWIVLLGLGIYLFGLFSRPLIEWIGLATILLGVAGLAAGLPYGTTHWLAAACFGIGMPLAGWLDMRFAGDGLMRRALALTIWLTLVLAPPLLFARIDHLREPRAVPLQAGDQALERGEQVLRLPPGSTVSLHVDLDSDLLAVRADDALTLTVLQPVEVALSDGRPDGRYRLGVAKWHAIRDGLLRLKIDRVTPELADSWPAVRLHAELDFAQPAPLAEARQ